MDSDKSMDVSAKPVDTPHSITKDVSVGQITRFESSNPPFLTRINEWIKLKPSEFESEYGKWSNVGKGSGETGK